MTRPAAREGGGPEQWHGTLLLLHPDAARSSRAGRVLLLAHEPAAAGGVLRGIDLLTPSKRSVWELGRPEMRAVDFGDLDFGARLGRLPVLYGGAAGTLGDVEGQCGLLALSTLAGLPSTRTVLGGALHLTDLLLDHNRTSTGPRGRPPGPALTGLQHALREAAPPELKMLLGCRAWTELGELEEQMKLGLWRAVEAAEGGQALGLALVRVREGPVLFALWEALWSMSEPGGGAPLSLPAAPA